MIRELILARALELATHDGAPAAAVVHIHSAASNLAGEIAREKDAAIADLLRSIATAPPTAAVPLEPAAEPAGAPPEAASTAPAETALDAAAAPGAPASDAPAEQVPA